MQIVCAAYHQQYILCMYVYYTEGWMRLAARPSYTIATTAAASFYIFIVNILPIIWCAQMNNKAYRVYIYLYSVHHWKHRNMYPCIKQYIYNTYIHTYSHAHGGHTKFADRQKKCEKKLRRRRRSAMQNIRIGCEIKSLAMHACACV